MLSVTRWFVLVLLLVCPRPGELNAQLWQAGAPGEDLGSIRIHAGLVQPRTDYSDGSSLESATSIGISGAYWPARHFGVMAEVFRAESGVAVGSQFSALEDQDPTIWISSLRAAVRLPLVMGNLGLSPYLAAGPTAKTYRWAIYTPQQGGLFERPYGGGRDTSFGWNFGGGAEVRFGTTGAFGLVADLKSIRSEFDWFGLRSSQSDLLFTTGITINR